METLFSTKFFAERAETVKMLNLGKQYGLLVLSGQVAEMRV
jgi:hypothetical protein